MIDCEQLSVDYLEKNEWMKSVPRTRVKNARLIYRSQDETTRRLA